MTEKQLVNESKSDIYKILRETVEEVTAPGSMFEITEIEVAGRPFRAWLNAPNSLRDVWLSSAVRGDADYLVYQDERWSYAEAHEQVSRVARWLANNGIQQHDRVAIAMRNYPEWLISFWAIVSIGAVPVGMNAWWVPAEMSYALKDSAAKLLICDVERLQRFTEIREDFPALPVVAVRVDEMPAWATAWHDLLTAEADMPAVEIDPDDESSIFYTSGTTGFPKGAQLTHRGCTNNILTMVFNAFVSKTAEAKIAGEELPELFPQNPDPVAAIISTPLFHVTANNGVAQIVTVFGGKLVHMYKWDADEALRILEEEEITSFTGVPTMSREIISHPEFLTRNTSNLEVLGGGGAPVHPDIIERISDSGHTVVAAQGYGLTETSCMVTGVRGIFQQHKPTSAGMVSPIFDIKCIDEAGNELPPGVPGEICIRGVQIIKGYLNRPEETAEAIVDGWFHSGDIGYLDDDNFVYLVDRAKDMILRGGENVYCAETEGALFKYPGVNEAAVFAVPDERLGEEVGAAVFVDAGKDISAAKLREFCKPLLAAYKIPRYIWILETPLPRNASGKFLKKELQQSLQLADAG